MQILRQYFLGSLIFSFVGLLACAGFGYYYGGTWTAVLQSLAIGFILAILEISLSFDNAIVNATVLKEMDAVWRRRFLTWGMAIAVFGMRLVFPILIVSVSASISPYVALKLALTDPAAYAVKMLENHVSIAAFGGAFLLLVGLEFFYDEHKERHWVGFLEKKLSHWGRIEAIEIFLTAGTLLAIMKFLPVQDQMTFLKSGLWGILTFIGVQAIGPILGVDEHSQKVVKKTGAAGFIYLEVLDASFSFDGVVGAFAITNNLLIIMAGLSIGAFFVRSLTILFVEKDVLTKFIYLEHGAFYAILLLATIMLFDPLLHIPEWFTGVSGAAIILISVLRSLKTGSS